MVKSIKSNLVLAGAGILLGAVILSYYNSNALGLDNLQPTLSITSNDNSDINTVTIPDLKHLTLPKAEHVAQIYDEFEALKLDLTDKIKQQYSSTIKNIAVQVSLKEFLYDLKKSYPVRGRELFEAIIKGAFPEFAEDIFRAVDTMAMYDEWLLDNALDLNDLRIPPANRLESLKANRKGQHSIRINDQYRICFIWNSGNVKNVEIIDYH